ncbi:MAG: VTT domain-containing protein [Clostridia bacterium]|nr:VTT domain-containing protein [Clostridia bacterium]
MEKAKRKSIIEKAVILGIAVLVVGLLIFFLSDVFIPFIKLQLARDIDGAKELLVSKGFAGYVTVPVVEALQMVVIFIPAEFIQLTSGMAYPWWLTLILCDIGVMIGCSMIYFLVNVLSFKGDIFNKQDRIERYEHMAKSKSTVIFMYLLFIMPIIPFGAICYYGSGKKVPYPRFLLTCATGVIPSISTSILMGTAVKEFIANAIPVWALVLIIIAAAAILFVLLAFVLYKYFFKTEKGMPNPWLLSVMAKIVLKLLSFKTRYRVINGDAVKKLDGSFIYVANHHSWRDMAAIYRIDRTKTVVGVINEFYFRIPVIGKLLKKAGNIGKKMFYPDIQCVKQMFKTVRCGYPIMIFPEARLSTDGGPSEIDGKISALCIKMGVPIVLVEIRNNYFIAPKWRPSTLRGRCDVEIKRIITQDELKAMDADSLTGVIRENLSYNEFHGEREIYRSKRKAEGLSGILYLCPHCGGMYTNVSYKNTLRCTACGKEYRIADDYRFEGDGIRDIYEYYGKIKEAEKKDLASVCLDIPVDVEVYRQNEKKVGTEKGVFHLDKDRVYFRSEITDLYFEYSTDILEGIAYSVNKEFEIYYQNDLYYFYPSEDDRAICTRVALLFELLKGAKEHE